jgi:hypothetical protein
MTDFVADESPASPPKLHVSTSGNFKDAPVWCDPCRFRTIGFQSAGGTHSLASSLPYNGRALRPDDTDHYGHRWSISPIR